MQSNVILAGVGGQGILTIAEALSIAAMRRGWQVKQVEVHGMAQRGGAVEAHLRLSDREIFSDLIPLGQADMILAVEPLEALRYLPYLGDDGCIVASAMPFVNIPNYPPIEEVLSRIAGFTRHVLIDAERIARAVGSLRAANTVMLGAASLHLGIELAEVESALAEMFAAKGSNVVTANQRAARLGRHAAMLYRDGLGRGGSPTDVRRWIETLPIDTIEAGDSGDDIPFSQAPEYSELSAAESHAIAQFFEQVQQDERSQLFEHEVYRIVELVGAISPPRHTFIPDGQAFTPDHLARFVGEQVVLKLVSQDVVHKSQAGGVMFVPRQTEVIDAEIRRMLNTARNSGARVAGVLVVEFVETGGAGFGQELFVGIRATREFGPIIAAGLGGVDTEFFAEKFQAGIAVAKALALDTNADEFFELFQATAAYDVISGKARGHRRVASDGELLRCFRAFIALARRFCAPGHDGPQLAELEVNPFAFVRQRVVPLDGRARLGKLEPAPRPRPLAKIRRMLEPRSIAVVGASAQRMNFGRIILNNVVACGFPIDGMSAVHEEATEIDGVRCAPSIDQLPGDTDLLVVATGSETLPKLSAQIAASHRIASVILIPGGVGETEGTADFQRHMRRLFSDSHARGDGGAVVLGGNCLGIRSRAGRYDTFFVPEMKMDSRREQSPRPLALLSQSGAFIVSRMSNLPALDPTICVSLGNQVDLTVSDMLRVVAERDDIQCVGVYMEGFNDLDGLAFVRAVGEATRAGKTVIFYKAGRTAPGREATAGHTASVAGDYDVCQAVAAQAGAMVVDTFKEFEQLLELATLLHGKRVGGRKLGAISNAGFEAVGMADTIRGARYKLDIAPLAAETVERIRAASAKAKLAALVNARNPLDLTAMAGEEAYEACAQAMIDDDGVDAVIVSVVPLTPALATTENELGRAGSLVERLPAQFRRCPKPMITVIDAGHTYDALSQALRDRGVPVFRSCDQAVRSLGRYICHRLDVEQALNPARREGVTRPPPVPRDDTSLTVVA